MKRQFVKAASAARMLDSFEAKLAEMKGSDVESATKVTCGEYIDTDGMFGPPGEIITDDFMREYWDSQYSEDPSLQEYESFEAWKEDTLPWLKPTDTSYADLYADGYFDIDASTKEVDDDLDPVKGEEGWNEDKVFMLMDYTAGDSGMESDTFDCYGKFFALDEADANRQLEEVKQTDPDRMSHMDGAYIQAYNDYFDDGDEVYPNLATLVKSTWIAPNDYDGNMYDEDLPFASTDINCSQDVFTEIEEPLAQDAEEPVEASMGRYDDYFGQTAAKKYGDLIASNLSGQTVSKRQDLAEEPGGLIYTANLLGIDMWDLLEALEGMCYEGRAEELYPGDSYKVH